MSEYCAFRERVRESERDRGLRSGLGGRGQGRGEGGRELVSVRGGGEREIERERGGKGGAGVIHKQRPSTKGGRSAPAPPLRPNLMSGHSAQNAAPGRVRP
jgi:hypothetical protein